MMNFFCLINMTGRLYDPKLGMFISPDPFIQTPELSLNYNRYSYCLNNPLKYSDPTGNFIFSILASYFCPPLVPIAVGIDYGWMSGGMKTSMIDGMSFWDGAWRGGLSGLIGGGLSMVGGSSNLTFIGDLLAGAASGAFTGGVNAALWKENIGKGTLGGAIGGAITTTLVSENLNNLIKGGGFHSDKFVFEKMQKSLIPLNYKTNFNSESASYLPLEVVTDQVSMRWEIMEYFGLEFRLDLTTESDGYINSYGMPFLGDGAFLGNYDNFKFAISEERFHVKEFFKTNNYENIPSEFYKSYGEYKAQIHQYKNQGLFLNHKSKLEHNMGYFYFSMREENLIKKFKTSNLKKLFYRIPRRW